MKAKVHFISGLPRSGSTMLAALLRQNPRFHSAMTSPVGVFFSDMMVNTGIHNDLAVFISEEKKRDLLKGLFDSYYADQSDKDVVFDTNRQWCARLPVLTRLYPDSKIICCVRDMAWILDSFEKLIRKNAFDISSLFSTPQERDTVYSRTIALASNDRVVGFAYSALKEAFYSEYSDRLLLVDYDILAQSPARTMELIYQFIEEEPFYHDFKNVSYDASEFDDKMGTPGLHRVEGAIEFRPRRSILPPDLFAQYSGLSFWQDQTGSSASVITQKPNDDANDTNEPMEQNVPIVAGELAEAQVLESTRKVS